MKTVLACLGAATLGSGKVYFSETFDDDWESRWVNSQWDKNQGRKGNFSLATGKYFIDEKEDRGIQTDWVIHPDRGYFYGVSAAFDSFSNAGKELIVQYQVKYERDLECGGASIKLGPKMNQTDFGEHTVSNIIFGPDKCGGTRSTRRTRLEFNFKGNTVYKKVPIEYMQEVDISTNGRVPLRGHDDGISHLYRMVLKPDNTVRVEVDMKKIYEGPIQRDWQGVMIDDPEDKMPSGWSNDILLDDPSDKMPDGWAAEMADPDARQPHDWDAEEDGEWQAPMITNPAYKGKWVAKRIYNKAFKGVWKAKQIHNPEYGGDNDVYKFADFGFIGFDLWQRTGGSILDNVIVCDDVAEAAAFAAKWKALSEHEKFARTTAIAEETRQKLLKEQIQNATLARRAAAKEESDRLQALPIEEKTPYQLHKEQVLNASRVRRHEMQAEKAAKEAALAAATEEAALAAQEAALAAATEEPVHGNEL